jgi:hypothetical protein
MINALAFLNHVARAPTATGDESRTPTESAPRPGVLSALAMGG